MVFINNNKNNNNNIFSREFITTHLIILLLISGDIFVPGHCTKKAEKAEETEKTEKARKVEKSEKVDKAAKVEKGEKIIKTEKTKKTEKTAKTRKAEKTGKATKTEKPKAEKPMAEKPKAKVGPDDESLKNTDGKIIGCFKITNSRRLKKEMNLQLVVLNKSQKSCMFRCRLYGLKYAVVYNGKVCFCGSNKPPSKKAIKSIDCSKICSPKKTKCRQKNTVRIYETMTPSSKSVEGNVYVGCFNQTTRSLNKFAELYIDMNFMTIQRCVYSCHSWFRRFAGLYMGTQCWCADKLLETDLTSHGANASNCNIPCTNKDKTCGGPKYLQLHALIYSFNRETPLAAYLGCYPFNEQQKFERKNIMQSYARRKLPQNKAQMMSISRCCYLCAVQKKPYAGVIKGNACYCSSTLRPNYKRHQKNDLVCNKPCTENSKHYCGGNVAMQVYKLRMGGFDWDTFGFII